MNPKNNKGEIDEEIEKAWDNAVILAQDSQKEIDELIVKASAFGFTISVGTLKLVNTYEQFWLLIIGWVVLALSFFYSLHGHRKSVKHAYELQDKYEETARSDKSIEFKRNKISKDIRDIQKKSETEIKKINSINFVILIIGIIFTLTFLSINLYAMSKNESNDNKSSNNPKPANENVRHGFEKQARPLSRNRSTFTNGSPESSNSSDKGSSDTDKK